MTGLYAALAAWIRHGEAVPADVTTYDRSIVHEGLRALLAEYAPTPSDQALRDLRAGVEARDRIARVLYEEHFDREDDDWLSTTDGSPNSASYALADRILASFAPATASAVESTVQSEECTSPARPESTASHMRGQRNHSPREGSRDDQGDGVGPTPLPATASEGVASCPHDELISDPCAECYFDANADDGLPATGVTSSDAATDPTPGLQVDVDAATPVTSSDGDQPRLCCPSIIGAPHDQDCEHHETTPPASSDGDRGLSEASEHVEWRVESETLEDEFGTDEEGARKWLVVCRTKPGWEPVTLMRRTVRTVVGPWESVGDTAGGEERG